MKPFLYALAIVGLGLVAIPCWMACEILAGRWHPLESHS